MATLKISDLSVGDWVEIQCNDHKELIDSLYDMVIMLKEEGVI